MNTAKVNLDCCLRSYQTYVFVELDIRIPQIRTESAVCPDGLWLLSA
ncbi:hypothetical protein [Altericista sp. CCNU0014]